MLAGCPILSGYLTSSGSYACWLSDSFRLSDKFRFIPLLVVGFFLVIRQVPAQMIADCRILLGYPTTLSSYACSLSDSSRLSDKFRFIRLLVVGFFLVIRQVPIHTFARCRILLGYPTSSGSYVYRLSDSSRLSDKFRFIRLLVVGFFPVIRQAPNTRTKSTQNNRKK